jgi:hypothetical protein
MGYTYEKREVTHGNAYGWYAAISQNEQGATTFGAATAFTGLRATSFETSEESNPYYADNVEHVRLYGAKTTEGSITTYQIRQDFLVNHLGKKLTGATPPALIDTGARKAFVWCHAETVTDEYGGEVNEYHIWTKVQAAAPTGETATEEDSVGPREIEIPCTASANSAITDSDDKPVTEIVWRDTEDGTVKGLMDGLFAETSPTTVAALIDAALGNTPQA